MLTSEQVIDAAIRSAGADDFGDPSFHEGLERGLAAFTELPLTEAARTAAEAKFVADLTNRLRIRDHLKRHPAAAEAGIDGPVLVCGLPRTGTTAMVAMMALDPRFRFLRGWEAMQPLPPPVADDEDADPRALAARAAAPNYANRAQHLFDPDGPEEDLIMLAGLDMRLYHGAYPMPDWYMRWWIEQDFTATYAVHRQALQVLQSCRPPHLWLLKAPPHLFKLEAFAQQYPNARYIMTHRDPAKIIPSVSSLHQRLHQERCPAEALNPSSYGPKYTGFWREGITRGLAARQTIGEDRFFDVTNEDVIKGPIETFEAIYAFLGMALDADLRARLDSYTQANARGTFGEHRYTAEEYGTSESAIREAFADYIARFGL